MLPHRCSALSSLLADKTLPIISPCVWTFLSLQITYKEETTPSPAEFCVWQTGRAVWRMLRILGQGLGTEPHPSLLCSSSQLGLGWGSLHPSFAAGFKSSIPNIQLQMNCTHNELGFCTLSVVITQEGVSCYNLSDILGHSTVPMFFQHEDFF